MDTRIEALLLDVDGTVCQRGALVAGVPEALRTLDARGIPRRFVTNMTSRSRAGIVHWLADMGLDVGVDEVFTSALAARDWLVERELRRCMLLVRPGLVEDFEGVEPVDERPEAVVLGDLGEGFAFDLLDRAFRAVLDGAELVALARNRYFLDGSGRLTLDVGPFVVALEYATGREATLVGKPSPALFLGALASIGSTPERSAMVGDDLEGDVGGAQSAGLRGILVRTGKFREALLTASSIRPDAVVDSLADLADAL